MLGGQKAGKTCYIGSFYAFYGVDPGNQGSNDSEFTVTGNSYTTFLLNKIARELKSTPPILPPTTDRIVDCVLNLRCYDDGELVERELHLFDHQGEALAGSGDPVMAAEFDRIIDQLQASDAFIVFLDASRILGSDEKLAATNTDWNKIHSILTNVASRLRRRSDTLPVVMVISKFDLAQTNEDRERLLAYARGCVDSLYQNQSNISVLICPVSVLRSTGRGDELERNLINIAAPFLFVSSSIILRNAAWHASQADIHRERGEAVERKIRQNKEAMRGLFRGIFRRVINSYHRVKKIVTIDQDINREVTLQENDLTFAEKAIDYLETSDNMKYNQLVFRGRAMSVGDYVDIQVNGIRRA